MTQIKIEFTATSFYEVIFSKIDLTQNLSMQFSINKIPLNAKKKYTLKASIY